jgi:membrane dipeptidase
MTAPRLIFDIHLDLSYNALDFNRDLRWTQERIRRRELGMKDQPFRTRNTVCFPEMRRGRVGLCVATQIARSVDPHPGPARLVQGDGGLRRTGADP